MESFRGEPTLLMSGSPRFLSGGSYREEAIFIDSFPKETSPFPFLSKRSFFLFRRVRVLSFRFRACYNEINCFPPKIGAGTSGVIEVPH